MEVNARLFILCPQTVLPVWMEIPLAMGLGLLNRLVLNALEPGSVRVVFLIWQFRAGSRFPMMLLPLVILIFLYLVVFRMEHSVTLYSDGASAEIR